MFSVEAMPGCGNAVFLTEAPVGIMLMSTEVLARQSHDRALRACITQNVPGVRAVVWGLRTSCAAWFSHDLPNLPLSS